MNFRDSSAPRAEGGVTDANGAKLQTISDIAREFNVTLRALRFYEDRGLLHPLRQGVARYYRPEDKVRLRMILTGKRLGFTLTEIRELLAQGKSLEDPETKEQAFELALQPDQIVAQIDHLERQRAELDEAIARLKDTHRRLSA